MPATSKWLGDVVETLFSRWIPLMFVTEIIYITASVIKIRFAGDLTGMKFRPGHAVAIRVSETEYRNYTPCNVDVKQGSIDIIFHLHGDAPGTRMLRKLQPGAEIRMTIPRGTNPYDPAARHHLLFGDETTLGLALSLHDIFKVNLHCYHYCFELDEENLHAPGLLGLDNFTIFLKSRSCLPGINKQIVNNHKSTLVNAGALFTQVAVDSSGIVDNLPTFEDLPYLASNHEIEDEDWLAGNFILAGNGASVQIVRKQLKKQNVTGNISAKGYWVAGKNGI
jgi:hypothetical protein